jgi:hypothetical protein
MLTGSDLLAKVKELGDVSKSELVRSCGYVSTKKDGSERLNFTAFYEALLGAKGVNLGTDSSGRGTGKGGRKPQLRDQDPVQRQPDGGQGLHRHARSAARR